MKLIILFFIIITSISQVQADFTSDNFAKVKSECMKHPLASEKYFDDKMWTRCTLIVQAISLFETNHHKKYQNNNLFNFRTRGLKKEWKDIWAIEVNNGWIVFDNTDSSIEFAVDRFYKIDRYKSIKQVISGGCYISPVDKKKKCFNGFTMNKEHYKNYIKFVEKFYRDYLLKI